MLEAWGLHDASTYRAFARTVDELGKPIRDARVLDIGCGPNSPMSVILHSMGVRVTGIDEHLGYRWGLGFQPRRYVHYLEEAGFARTLRKMLGELVYDRRYYAALRKCLGLALTDRGLDVRRMSAERLLFENSAFDVIHSNATWEHVRDVGQANRELARVLRPGGIAYVEIHLFASLSGGHDLPWIVPGTTELGNALPWQHLRNPSWRPPIFLNRLRERDYRVLFEETAGLQIIDWRTEFTEGEDLLTDEVLAELPGYTVEELTKRSVIVLLRKSS